MTAGYFASAQGERAQAAIELQVENAFGRLVSDIVANPPTDLRQEMEANSRLVVPENASCFRQPIFKDTMSCRIMDNFSHYESCPFTGNKMYLNLVQPQYLPSGHETKDRVLLDDNFPKRYLSFDPTTFPSFCGKSATFSMWVENWGCGARATLLARYPKTVTTATADKPSEPSKRVKGSWFFQIDQDSSSGGTKCCIGQIPADGVVAYWKCAILEPKLNCMTANTRRHLALVMNKDDNTIKFYIDGTLAKSVSSELPAQEKWIDDNDAFGGGVGRLDCHMDSSQSYSPLGHRIPGEKQYVGPIQDWRYYVGHALTGEEIKNIADSSLDAKGKILRTCKLANEGRDSNFKDIYGHDCAWYQERSKTFPGICSSVEVRQQCPIACSAFLPCYEGNDMSAKRTFSIWERQMPIREYGKALNTNGDSICVRQGIDAVKNCRDNEANPQTFPLIGKTDYSMKGDGRPGNGRWCNSPPAPPEVGGCKNLKVWDCDVLQVAVNPSCSFAVNADWTKKINADIRASGGYTLSFWWKAMEGTTWDTINTGQMLAYSSLVPPRVLFALDFFGNGDSINYWIEVYDTCNDALENLNNIDGGEEFVVGSWYFVAVVVGSPLESGDGRSLFVMSGSQPGTQALMKTSWCSHFPDSEDFIQAITVPGGLVISPIEVTGAGLTVKELQNSYYAAKPQFRLRRGPASLDEDRLQSAIEYETPVAGYPFPTSLVAPPILLQRRRVRTDQCKYALGSEYNTKVWETAVEVTCRPPYECSDDLTGTRTSLMACSSEAAPEQFWGRSPIMFNDQLQFYEFLQTIADAPFVERNGSVLETRGFLDAQTETISCLMITYSSQYGTCIFVRHSLHFEDFRRLVRLFPADL